MGYGLKKRLVATVSQRFDAWGWDVRQQALFWHMCDQLWEQVAAVVPISLWLVFCLGVFFQTQADSGLQLAGGLVAAIIGLTVFVDGLRVCVMPLGELVGKELPDKYPLPVVLLVAFALGILVTYAEPTIASLRPLADLVSKERTPYLYFALNQKQEILVLCICIGVGMAAVLGTLMFVYNWSLKPMLVGVITPTVGIACYMKWGNPDLEPLISLAWDCGGGTTGPVTVPILLAMGIGVMKSMRQKRVAKAVLRQAVTTHTAQALEGFGIISLASLVPVLVVELMAIVYGATYSKEDILAFPDQVAKTKPEEQAPLSEVVFAIRAVLPLNAALILLVVLLCRVPLPDLSVYTISLEEARTRRRERDLATASVPSVGPSGRSLTGPIKALKARSMSLKRGDAADDSCSLATSSLPVTQPSLEAVSAGQGRLATMSAGIDSYRHTRGAQGGALVRASGPVAEATEASLPDAAAAVEVAGAEPVAGTFPETASQHLNSPVASDALPWVTAMSSEVLPAGASGGHHLRTASAPATLPDDVRVLMDARATPDSPEEQQEDGQGSKRGGCLQVVWGWRHWPLATGIVMQLIGMILFSWGLTYAFTSLGDQAGTMLPAAYLEVPGFERSPYYDYVGGIILVVVVVAVLGVLATRAEPGLIVLGRTVENLSGGQFSASMLSWSVSVGVGVGMAVGACRILFSVSTLYIIMAKYGLAVILTYFCAEDFTNIAWDSAGVTTGPVTVPFVLAIGVGFSKAVDADEGFGILTAASVAPIIAVLIANLLKKPIVYVGHTVTYGVSTGLTKIHSGLQTLSRNSRGSLSRLSRDSGRWASHLGYRLSAANCLATTSTGLPAGAGAGTGEAPAGGDSLGGGGGPPLTASSVPMANYALHTAYRDTLDDTLAGQLMRDRGSSLACDSIRERVLPVPVPVPGAQQHPTTGRVRGPPFWLSRPSVVIESRAEEDVHAATPAAGAAELVREQRQGVLARAVRTLNRPLASLRALIDQPAEAGTGRSRPVGSELARVEEAASHVEEAGDVAAGVANK